MAGGRNSLGPTMMQTVALPPGGFGFRPMRRADLPMLGTWLQGPGVARWFTDSGYIHDLAAQLADDRIRQQIVLLGQRPVAYVQDYDIHAFKDHPLAFLPPGARGIDTFIGSASDQGQGIGTAYLRQLVADLARAGVPAFGIDPDPGNAAAIRAYPKVGFRPHGQVMTEWGLVLLMGLETRTPGATPSPSDPATP
jgi:aminoglycoside 6'-N-acetyltransferase